MATVQFTPEFIAHVRPTVHATLADQQNAENLQRSQIKVAPSRPETQEEDLLGLAADGGLPSPKVRQGLNDITTKRAQLQHDLEGIDRDLTGGAKLIESTLVLLRDPAVLYRRVSDHYRRIIVQCLFTKLYVERDCTVSDEIRQPFAKLVAAHRLHADDVSQFGPKTTTRRSARPSCNDSAKPGHLALALADEGSSKTAMVELRGFEPLTPWLQTRCSAN